MKDVMYIELPAGISDVEVINRNKKRLLHYKQSAENKELIIAYPFEIVSVLSKSESTIVGIKQIES